jgi:ribosomal protein L7/L12
METTRPTGRADQGGADAGSTILMAELTNLETKLGEVIGLAMAAQVTTSKVIKMAQQENGGLVGTLEQMNREARETEERGVALASSFEGKKTAILKEARDVKRKGATMLSTYLDDESDALDGFEFLTMAEAAEVGHWAVLRELTARGGHGQVQSLIEWALPIQERHFQAALDGSKQLAAAEDPEGTS